MTDILSSLNWRYATKSYDPAKKLSSDQRKLIMEALRLSPSSLGLQAWQFVHVSDPTTRLKLLPASYGQTPVTEASDLFVLASRLSINEAYVDSFMESIANTRGLKVDTLAGYKGICMQQISGKTPAQLEEWLARQVYIPLGVALTAAAVNNIDATPMEGFDPGQFDQILGLKKLGLSARVMMAVGFRSADDKSQYAKKARFSTSEMFIER
ncbi:MAG: NAD(P)H-dependent oxidoreductase [Candidatus Roizmanbacteria bacterium]